MLYSLAIRGTIPEGVRNMRTFSKGVSDVPASVQMVGGPCSSWPGMLG